MIMQNEIDLFIERQEAVISLLEQEQHRTNLEISPHLSFDFVDQFGVRKSSRWGSGLTYMLFCGGWLYKVGYTRYSLISRINDYNRVHRPAKFFFAIYSVSAMAVEQHILSMVRKNSYLRNNYPKIETHLWDTEKIKDALSIRSVNGEPVTYFFDETSAEDFLQRQKYE